MRLLTRWHHTRTAGGFTLIEMLLVVALTTMLMYAMGEIFKLASGVVGGNEAEVEVRQKARSIFSRLEIDVQTALLNREGDTFIIKPGTLGSRVADSLRLVSSVKFDIEGVSTAGDVNRVSYVLVGEVGAKEALKRKGLPTDEPKDPLLIRYSRTFVSGDAAKEFNRDHPNRPNLTQYPGGPWSDDPEDNPQFIDLVAGNVLDFQIDRVLPGDLAGVTLDVNGLNGMWKHLPVDARRDPIPRAIRVSVTLLDDKARIERTFESVIPIKVSNITVSGS